MTYTILKYGRLMWPDVENLEEAKKEALRFVTVATGSEFIEIQDSASETVTIGYFDGRRFHWTRDKSETEAWKGCRYVTKASPWLQGKTEEVI